MLRVVVDTNVFVSSLLTKQGASAQVIDAWRKRRYVLVTSPAIISEIRATLCRPHIRDQYGITNGDIQYLAILLQRDALLVPGNAEMPATTLADPKDNIFLTCALDGQADLIVSGDHHLLSLGKFRDISIITVRQFLDLLASV
jgi:putative PIN family toxin of toxin-antitoxin system